MAWAVVTTLAAAVAFAAFHIPLPGHRDGPRAGRWRLRPLAGRPAHVCGLAYHALMLPAVAALPAPAWAEAAGFAWMLADMALEVAGLAGAAIDAGPIREGLHLVACLWLLGAGWSGGPELGLIGTALAAAFVARLAGRVRRGRPAAWARHASALLNVLWIVAVAVALA
ncbi:MAG: hypothetical protein LBR33_08440 [Propionibacteriaceae bacterium]|jgi:hypothetical protein|nr:hypothetical protein [Propionibacteriaceae bacterium]